MAQRRQRANNDPITRATTIYYRSYKRSNWCSLSERNLFGLNSGAALATVVGVLVGVPIMLSVVKIVKASRPWYEERVPA